MKNNISKKLIAGLMVTVFTVSNLGAASFALNGYYDYDGLAKPMLRSDDITTLDVNSTVKIPNANSVVNVSLRDADIKQVLRMFADQAGMNIIFAPSVDGTVTLDLVDIPLEEALNLVIKTNDLFFLKEN